MSRRTVRWREIAVQCGHVAEDVRPRGTKGRGRFRAQELENWQIEAALDKVCTRPISDEKWARIRPIIEAKPAERTKRRHW